MSSSPYEPRPTPRPRAPQHPKLPYSTYPWGDPEIAREAKAVARSAAAARAMDTLSQSDPSVTTTTPSARRRFALFDMDGTLIQSNEKFWNAKAGTYARAAERVAAVGHELAIAEMQEIFFAITESDFAQHRTRPEHFADRMRRAYTEALGRYQAEATAEDLAWIDALATQIATDHYEPFAGMHAMLADLRAAGVRIGLCTKGADRALQQRKIDAAGLAPYLDAYEITVAKNASSWRALYHALGGEGEPRDADVIIIGDSYKDEVVAAAELGVPSVWIRPANNPWEHDAHYAHETSATFCVDVVTELRQALPAWFGPTVTPVQANTPEAPARVRR